jgi:hypothetical protein
VIHYDEENRTVRSAHNQRTRELLQLAGVTCRRSWHRAYLLVIGAMLLTALLSFGGVLQSAALPAWVPPATVLIGGLGLIGGYQYYTRDRIEVVDCGVLTE